MIYLGVILGWPFCFGDWLCFRFFIGIRHVLSSIVGWLASSEYAIVCVCVCVAYMSLKDEVK